jgi:Unpaired protein
MVEKVKTRVTHSSKTCSSLIFLQNRPKKWYNDTQMYVAAFQFLYRKQLNYDQINNDGNAESEELRSLMNQAKSLLCEIEIFINVTMKGNKVKIFTREEMSEILKFRSNGSHVKSVLETVDKMFTKAKFQQYITGLLPVIQKRKRIANLQTKNLKPINCKRLVDPIKQKRCRNKKRQNQARLNALNGTTPTKKGSNLNNAARQRLNKNKQTNMANNKRKQQIMNKKPNATVPNKKPKLQQQPKQTVLRKFRKDVKNNAINS